MRSLADYRAYNKTYKYNLVTSVYNHSIFSHSVFGCNVCGQKCLWSQCLW